MAEVGGRMPSGDREACKGEDPLSAVPCLREAAAACARAMEAAQASDTALAAARAELHSTKSELETSSANLRVRIAALEGELQAERKERTRLAEELSAVMAREAAALNQAAAAREAAKTQQEGGSSLQAENARLSLENAKHVARYSKLMDCCQRQQSKISSYEKRLGIDTAHPTRRNGHKRRRLSEAAAAKTSATTEATAVQRSASGEELHAGEEALASKVSGTSAVSSPAEGSVKKKRSFSELATEIAESPAARPLFTPTKAGALDEAPKAQAAALGAVVDASGTGATPRHGGRSHLVKDLLCAAPRALAEALEGIHSRKAPLHPVAHVAAIRVQLPPSEEDGAKTAEAAAASGAAEEEEHWDFGVPPPPPPWDGRQGDDDGGLDDAGASGLGGRGTLASRLKGIPGLRVYDMKQGRVPQREEGAVTTPPSGRAVRAEGSKAAAAAAAPRSGVPCRCVVRGREVRLGLQPYDCEQCRRFHAATGVPVSASTAGGNSRRVRPNASRHRFAFAPVCTPEGFWDLSFPDRDGDKQ
eukprot:gnl/TRDRNA2_/TRDRNA2_180922_c0_seq1.p1 gnl/TRDRNA2_/TRDRNA2_180922_c0~~gnl/TRDRNA2_/TRDRNA2_180922_c0_seq1.p1  ORF type:complete len:542 (-),score=103.73 gnl/TRDRNA2_/TRDRNA2_180922_c0_seq1:265-1863(-)